MGYGVEPFFVPAHEGVKFDVDKFYNVRTVHLFAFAVTDA